MTRFLCVFVVFAGGAFRAGLAADMQYPLSIAGGKDQAVFVADRFLPGIWKISDGKFELYFQGSKKFGTPLNAVRCVAVDSKGRLVAGDSATRDIYRFNAENKPEPLTKARIGTPMAIAFDSKGDILVCDLEIQQVVKVPEAGGEPVMFAEVTGPRGIAVDADDRAWVISNGGKNQVLRILPDGKVEKVPEGRPFEFPNHIALDKDQNAYVCDNYSHAVWRIPKDGKPEKWISGKPLDMPVGVAVVGENVWIADPHAKMIFQATLDGKLTPVKFEAAATPESGK